MSTYMLRVLSLDPVWLVTFGSWRRSLCDTIPINFIQGLFSRLPWPPMEPPTMRKCERLINGYEVLQRVQTLPHSHDGGFYEFLLWLKKCDNSSIRLYSSWSNEKMPLWFMLRNITALLTPWDKNLLLYLVALLLVKSFNSINFYWSWRTKEAANDKRISSLEANTPKRERGGEEEIVSKLHNSFISLNYSRNFLFCRLSRKTKRARKIIWFFYLINYA